MKYICQFTGLLFASQIFASDPSPTPKPAEVPDSGTPSVATAMASQKSVTGIVIATDYPSLQEAVNALPPTGGTIILPPGTYILDKPLDLADTYQHGEPKVTASYLFQGSGRLTTIIRADFRKTKEFKDAPLIDATNGSRNVWNDVTFAGDCNILYLSARRDTRGGGGNTFSNVFFRVEGASIGLALLGSECNRLFNCEVSVSTEDGVGIAFLPRTEFEINGKKFKAFSPYVGGNLTGGSNTELRLYGTNVYSFGQKSVGLYAEGSTADISIFGGYFANSGYSSLYFDGTRGNFGDTVISGLRVEGETGRYALYAKGMVRNLVIETSCLGSAGEVIRYESAPGFYGETSFAEGWHLRNNSFSIQDQTQRFNEPKGGKGFEIPHKDRALIRMDRIVNCTVENIWNRGYVINVTKEPAKGKPDSPGENADYATVIQNENFKPTEKLSYFNPKTLIVTQSAEGSTVSVPDATLVSLPADGTTRTQVVALGDDGGNVRRTYHGMAGGMDILNLQPSRPSSIKSPKLGDIIVVPPKPDGEKPVGARPAFFDGIKWRYFNLE
jgi:hypothetical protein